MGKLPQSLLYAFLFVLCWPYRPFGAQWLGERAFKELSEAQIRTLITTPDPIRNLDPGNRNSHLARILIPRPRMYQTCIPACL